MIHIFLFYTYVRKMHTIEWINYLRMILEHIFKVILQEPTYHTSPNKSDKAHRRTNVAY